MLCFTTGRCKEPTLLRVRKCMSMNLKAFSDLVFRSQLEKLVNPVLNGSHAHPSVPRIHALHIPFYKIKQSNPDIRANLDYEMNEPKKYTFVSFLPRSRIIVSFAALDTSNIPSRSLTIPSICFCRKRNKFALKNRKSRS